MKSCPKCGGKLVPFHKYEEPLLICENQHTRSKRDPSRPACDYQVTVREASQNHYEPPTITEIEPE